jgi:hypothetical protein
MAEKKNNRKFNLPETKGSFQIRGVVSGTKKQDFYVETETATTKKPKRTVNFGIQTHSDSTVYIRMQGFTKDNVCFYNKETKTNKAVPWENRLKFKEKDFSLIGTNIGLTKKIDDKGTEVNDKVTLPEFDDCKYVSEHLQDGQSLFVKGALEFSSFTKNDTMTRYINYKPNQISLCKPVDFESEDFTPLSDFEQTIVFLEATLDTTDKDDQKGIIKTKIVTYQAIEDVEFIVRDKKLFSDMKKNLKPYDGIDVSGHIVNKVIVEETTDADLWGEPTSFDEVKKTYIREMVITSAKPGSIATHKDKYSEEKINEALRALREFGETKSETDDSAWGADTADKDDAGWE